MSKIFKRTYRAKARAHRFGAPMLAENKCKACGTTNPSLIGKGSPKVCAGCGLDIYPQRHLDGPIDPLEFFGLEPFDK